MIDSGLEAILIKVAGIGLTTKHLGKTLADMEPTLTKLVHLELCLALTTDLKPPFQNNLYGSHICGEGGEYESLTLDCPLFEHRIVL
jgi:diphthine-ammonia ligase